MGIMTNIEFAKKHEDIAKNYKTIYAWGCFGHPVSEGIIQEKAKQYPSWYTEAKKAELRRLIGKGYFCFDCICTSKAIGWKWTGNPNSYTGGAKYNTNGVPDLSADGMIQICKDVSTTNWDKMAIGEGLWMPGHWGVYIGNGLAVECTTAWDCCVQITAVGNIGSKFGYHTRRWTKHGKLPWIDYVESEDDKVHAANKAKVKSRFGFTDSTIAWLDSYKWNKDLMDKLANSK